MLSLPWAIPSLPVWGSSAQHLESSRMRQVTGLCVFVNLLRFIHENSWPGPSRAALPAHLLPYRRLWLREHSSTYSAAGGGPADRDTHSFSSRGRPGEAGDEPEDPTQQLEGYGS